MPNTININFDEIDFQDFTLGELDELETACGIPLDALGSPQAPKAKLIGAMVWLLGKRDNPEFTWEEAKQIKLSELDFGTEDSPKE